MRGLLCDALAGLWRALTAPLRTLISDAIADARDRIAREEEIAAAVAARTWTCDDDAALQEYMWEPE